MVVYAFPYPTYRRGRYARGYGEAYTTLHFENKVNQIKPTAVLLSLSVVRKK